MKRGLSLLLCVMLCLTGVTVYATEPESTDPFTVAIDKSNDIYQLTFTLNENAGNEVTIDMQDAMLEAINTYESYVLPGDSFQYEIKIVNASGHEYAYQNNSFVLKPSVEGVPSDEMSPFESCAGTLIPYDYIAVIPVNHEAIYKELFGQKGSADVTAEMLFGIDGTLAQKGYQGEDALTQFFLDYYNDYYAQRDENWQDCASWDELVAKKPGLADQFARPGSNSIFTMSYGMMQSYCEQYPRLASYVRYESVDAEAELTDDSAVKVQLILPEVELATFSYDFFYQEYLSFVYGASEIADFNPNRNTAFTRTRGVGDYDEISSELYQQTNRYFQSLENASDLMSGEELTFETKFGLDGPGIGNAYTYTSNDGPITLVLDPARNRLIVVYQREVTTQTKYTVEHQYYTSTDGGDYQLDGSVVEEAKAGTIGKTITMEDLVLMPEYVGQTYAYVENTGPITLVAEASENHITITYHREVKTPVIEEPEQPGTDDPTSETPVPSDEPTDDQTVQTGDTQMLKPYVLAGSITLVIGCLVLVDQKRSKLFKR